MGCLLSPNFRVTLTGFQGKRSVSDQMNEAVNYINQLQKNIKELSAKRDELKKPSNSDVENHETKHASSSFTVHLNNGAAGIEITCAFREEAVLPLSNLLELLFQEGLDVVTCLSTEVNGRLLHSVQCEVRVQWFFSSLYIIYIFFKETSL